MSGERYYLLTGAAGFLGPNDRALGETTRPYQQTIHDEVRWMIEEGLIGA